jgi:proline-specific peptidase
MSSSTEHNSSDTYGYGTPTQAGKIRFRPPGTNLNCETAYWLWGDLTSKIPPLIVLHGGPAAPGRDWKAIAVLYKRRGIPVLLYDQIGCGESSHLRHRKGDTGFWTDALFHAELDNIKQYFQIGTFDLLGHSCGGMLAVLYALTQPKGLRKLVIASAPASEALRVKPMIQQQKALPQEMQDALALHKKEGASDSPAYKAAGLEWARRHLCRLDPWPPEMMDSIGLMEDDNTVALTLYGPDALNPTGSRKDYDVIDRLHEISSTTVPGGVLLTNGRYDMSQDEVMAPFFTSINARVKWVRFAESSHTAHLEEHEAYITALGDFLSIA